MNNFIVETKCNFCGEYTRLSLEEESLCFFLTNTDIDDEIVTSICEYCDSEISLKIFVKKE